MPHIRRAFGHNLLVFANESEAFAYALTAKEIFDFRTFGTIDQSANALDLGPVSNSAPMPLGKRQPYIARDV